MKLLSIENDSAKPRSCLVTERYSDNVRSGELK